MGLFVSIFWVMLVHNSFVSCCSLGLGYRLVWAHWRTACSAAALGSLYQDPAASEVNIINKIAGLFQYTPALLKVKNSNSPSS